MRLPKSFADRRTPLKGVYRGYVGYWGKDRDSEYLGFPKIRGAFTGN